MIHYRLIILQVLTYALQSIERSNYEQAALNERVQDYKLRSRRLIEKVVFKSLVQVHIWW